MSLLFGLTKCLGEVVKHPRDGRLVAGPRLGRVAPPRLIPILLFLQFNGIKKLQIGRQLFEFGDAIVIAAMIPQYVIRYPISVIRMVVIEGRGGLGHRRGGSLEGRGSRPAEGSRDGPRHGGGGGQLVPVGRRRRLRGGRETHAPAPVGRRWAQRRARLGNARPKVVASVAVGAASKAVR